MRTNEATRTTRVSRTKVEFQTYNVDLRGKVILADPPNEPIAKITMTPLPSRPKIVDRLSQTQVSAVTARTVVEIARPVPCDDAEGLCKLVEAELEGLTKLLCLAQRRAIFHKRKLLTINGERTLLVDDPVPHLRGKAWGHPLIEPNDTQRFLDRAWPLYADKSLQERTNLAGSLGWFLVALSQRSPLEVRFLEFWIALESLARNWAEPHQSHLILDPKDFKHVLPGLSEAVSAVLSQSSACPSQVKEIVENANQLNRRQTARLVKKLLADLRIRGVDFEQLDKLYGVRVKAAHKGSVRIIYQSEDGRSTFTRQLFRLQQILEECYLHLLGVTQGDILVGLLDFDSRQVRWEKR